MMQHYVNQLPTAWALNPGAAPTEVLTNMRKIAAIAVQCLEVHGVVPRETEGVGKWGQRSIEERRQGDDDEKQEAGGFLDMANELTN